MASVAARYDAITVVAQDVKKAKLFSSNLASTTSMTCSRYVAAGYGPSPISFVNAAQTPSLACYGSSDAAMATISPIAGNSMAIRAARPTCSISRIAASNGVCMTALADVLGGGH